MVDELDFSGLKEVLIAAGLNPDKSHDMRLFSIELSEPDTTITEAAQRAGARKARIAVGGGFELLSYYLSALREDYGGTHAPAAIPGEHASLDGLRMLELAIANFREKGKK